MGQPSGRSGPQDQGKIERELIWALVNRKSWKLSTERMRELQLAALRSFANKSIRFGEVCAGVVLPNAEALRKVENRMSATLYLVVDRQFGAAAMIQVLFKERETSQSQFSRSVLPDIMKQATGTRSHKRCELFVG